MAIDVHDPSKPVVAGSEAVSSGWASVADGPGTDLFAKDEAGIMDLRCSLP